MEEKTLSSGPTASELNIYYQKIFSQDQDVKDNIAKRLIKELIETDLWERYFPIKFTREDVVFVSKPREDLGKGKIIRVSIVCPYVYYYTMYMNYDDEKQKPILEICIEDEYIREEAEDIFLGNMYL